MNVLPSRSDFEAALERILASAAAAGQPSVTVKAGELHAIVGGYPGHNHRMPPLLPGDERHDASRRRGRAEPAERARRHTDSAVPPAQIVNPSNFAFDWTAGSRSLATAGQREHWASGSRR